ncbi:MAG TPA: hypothetical protein VIM89_04785 [Mucilaginibacter sp.]
MKRLHACAFGLVFLLFSNLSMAQSRLKDTLIDVGGYALHFVIKEGKGTPILLKQAAVTTHLPGKTF